jgi:hypothetical protein
MTGPAVQPDVFVDLNAKSAAKSRQGIAGTIQKRKK